MYLTKLRLIKSALLKKKQNKKHMAEVNSVLMPAVNFKHTMVFSRVGGPVSLGNRMNTLPRQVSKV